MPNRTRRHQIAAIIQKKKSERYPTTKERTSVLFCYLWRTFSNFVHRSLGANRRPLFLRGTNCVPDVPGSATQSHEILFGLQRFLLPSVSPYLTSSQSSVHWTSAGGSAKIPETQGAEVWSTWHEGDFSERNDSKKLIVTRLEGLAKRQTGLVLQERNYPLHFSDLWHFLPRLEGRQKKMKFWHFTFSKNFSFRQQRSKAQPYQRRSKTPNGRNCENVLDCMVK